VLLRDWAYRTVGCFQPVRFSMAKDDASATTKMVTQGRVAVPAASAEADGCGCSAATCDVCLGQRQHACTCAFCSNRACRDCHMHCDCDLVACDECVVHCPCGRRQCEDCVKHCFECDVTFCEDCWEGREGVECDECGDGLCRTCFEVASDKEGCSAIRGCSGCDAFVCASCCGEEQPIASLGMPVRELPQLAPIAALEAEVLRAFGARDADLAKEEDTEELMHRLHMRDTARGFARRAMRITLDPEGVEVSVVVPTEACMLICALCDDPQVNPNPSPAPAPSRNPAPNPPPAPDHLP